MGMGEISSKQKLRPHVLEYDVPRHISESVEDSNYVIDLNNDVEENRDKLALNNDKEQSDIQVPSWIESEKLKVIFTPRSLNDLENILLVSKFTNKEDLRQAIVDVLQEDP